MRKLIIASSLALIAVFAVLLANADDTSMSDSGAEPQEYASSQQAGTAAGTTPKESGMKADHWKTAKTCTDESGVVHKRGQKGFNICVEHMRKKEQQMGGTLAPPASPGPQSGEMSPSGSDSGSQD